MNHHNDKSIIDRYAGVMNLLYASDTNLMFGKLKSLEVALKV